MIIFIIINIYMIIGAMLGLGLQALFDDILKRDNSSEKTKYHTAEVLKAINTHRIKYAMFSMFCWPIYVIWMLI